MEALGFGTIGGELESYLLLALAVSNVFQRIAQVTPGKKDDEIANKMELFVRMALDFVAGNHGTPGDTSARKPAEKPVVNKLG
jgi:hypothetical protein